MAAANGRSSREERVGGGGREGGGVGQAGEGGELRVCVCVEEGWEFGVGGVGDWEPAVTFSFFVLPGAKNQEASMFLQ